MRGFFANVQTDSQPHPSELSDCISTVMTGSMSPEEEVSSMLANDQTFVCSKREGVSGP